MKFPVIGGVAFLASGAAALTAVAMMSSTGGAAPASTAKVAPAKPAASAAPTTLVFSVPDMHCELACAPVVRETLAGVPGVEKVETDTATQKVTVVTGDGFEIGKALAALKGVGYPGKRIAE